MQRSVRRSWWIGDELVVVNVQYPVIIVLLNMPKGSVELVL